MLRCSRVLAVVLTVTATLAACAKKKDESASTSGSATTTTTTTPPPAADAMTPAVGSGSDMAGSGSGSGSGSGAGSDMAGSGSGSAAAGSAAAVDFDKLSHDEQIKFMKTNVVPPMKAAFQKFDPKAFANFGCKTCHGKDPQKAKYKMPSPDIPALDFDALKRGDDKEIAEFMAHTVKPEMAKILGVPEMTETQEGFGCLECHTQKKKKKG